MREKLDYLGYNLEEAYFHRKNQELLKKLREEKEKRRSTENGEESREERERDQKKAG